MIARLIAWLLGCRHRNLGVWFRRGGRDWRTCTDCGRAVLAKVQLTPDARFRPPEPSRARDVEYGQTGLERMGVKL